MAGYASMVEEIKSSIGADEEPAILEEVASYGADAGWSGFTYTAECVDFYNRHEAAIWDLLFEDAESVGENVPAFVGGFARADMAADPNGFKNLLAWYALETVARRAVDNGEHVADEDGE